MKRKYVYDVIGIRHSCLYTMDELGTNLHDFSIFHTHIEEFGSDHYTFEDDFRHILNNAFKYSEEYLWVTWATTVYIPTVSLFRKPDTIISGDSAISYMMKVIQDGMIETLLKNLQKDEEFQASTISYLKSQDGKFFRIGNIHSLIITKMLMCMLSDIITIFISSRGSDKLESTNFIYLLMIHVAARVDEVNSTIGTLEYVSTDTAESNIIHMITNLHRCENTCRILGQLRNEIPFKKKKGGK